MAYAHDFFVSYPAKCGAGTWTRKYFLPTFCESYQDEVGNLPALYDFAERETAQDWPAEVATALSRSRYMIAILTPPYFYESKWCPAEWATMAKRQELVTFPKKHEHQQLIIPVLYSDGDNLPAHVGTIRRTDMREFAYPDDAFQSSASFMEFRKAVRHLAVQASKMVAVAPQWKSTWPVLRPPPLNRPLVNLPRLR
jgi:hypothetical protein